MTSPLVIVSSLVLLASISLAQDRSEAGADPSAPPAVELLCLERLDADRTLPVVRALVPRDTQIVVDAQTNCIVVVGAMDGARVRSTIATLETYVERRQARERRAR